VSSRLRTGPGAVGKQVQAGRRRRTRSWLPPADRNSVAACAPCARSQQRRFLRPRALASSPSGRRSTTFPRDRAYPWCASPVRALAERGAARCSSLHRALVWRDHLGRRARIPVARAASPAACCRARSCGRLGFARGLPSISLPCCRPITPSQGAESALWHVARDEGAGVRAAAEPVQPV